MSALGITFNAPFDYLKRLRQSVSKSQGKVTKMHKLAPNCTYIEDNVDMTARERDEMYRDAYQQGYEQAKREVRELSPAPRNVRDFFYSLGKFGERK